MRILLIVISAFIIACSGSKSDKDEVALPEKSGDITVVAGEKTNKDDVNPFIAYNITGEYMVKYAPDGEETPTTKAIGAHVVIRNNPYASIHQSLLMKRLSKEFIVKCSACHDDYGNGVIGPSLLTKTSDEVYDMIIKYRTDKKENILMRELVLKMTDEEIRFIADDIAKFNEELHGEKNK